MHAGERLKRIREEENLSLKETAKTFDNYCNSATLSKWENSRSPDFEFVSLFGKHFKLCGDWLLYGRGKKRKNSDEWDRDPEDIITELTDVVKKEELEDKPVRNKRKSGDITGATTENYLELLTYMANVPEINDEILKFFHHKVLPRYLNKIKKEAKAREKIETKSNELQVAAV